MHRDLKPENILFIRNELKIADPGLSCSISRISDSGTEEFRPRGKAGGEQADFYAIGKIIYCLYTRGNVACFPEIPAGIDIRSIAAWNEIALKCCGDGTAYRSIAEIREDVRKIGGPARWRDILRRTGQYAFHGL